MLAKIQKWGNSQGLRITKALLSDAQINVGDRGTPVSETSNVLLLQYFTSRNGQF